MAREKEKKKTMHTLTEALTLVGGFGRFQKAINLAFCIMTIPSFSHVMITFFTADAPSWKCAANSTSCYDNATMPSEDTRRCNMNLSDWSYTTPKTYSIVTEWHIDCNREWLRQMAMSIFFFGWLIGAPTLGWFADTYGRRVVLIHSMNFVLLTGFITAFLPNIYFFICSRFAIGFFLPGTFPQMFIIITEIVDDEHRVFSGIVIYTFAAVTLAFVGLKAYFIRNWKLLYIVTSAPYTFLIFFYQVIPRSLQYLHSKGKGDELMLELRRMAKWNNVTLPENMSIRPSYDSNATERSGHDHSNTLKMKKLVMITLLQSVVLFFNVITYYGLYIAAADIGGSLYLDFIIVTVAEIPLSLIAIYLSNRFGRKKTTLFFVFISIVACVGLIFTPKSTDFSSLRISFGMIGKGCNGAAFITLTSWGADLYPVRVRAEAMGILQVFTRLGGVGAPWMVNALSKAHKCGCLSFVFMSIASAICFFLLYLLPSQDNDVQVVSPKPSEEMGKNIERGRDNSVCGGENDDDDEGGKHITA